MFPLKIECLVNLGIYTLRDSHRNVDKWTNKCKLAFLLLLFLHFSGNFWIFIYDKGCPDICTNNERHCFASHVMFTKSKRTIYKNIVIHTATRCSGRPANLQWRLDEWTERKLAKAENFTTTVMNHLLKVLGLVVSHSVFSPFYSQTPIMLNLSKFKTWFSALNFSLQE